MSESDDVQRPDDMWEQIWIMESEEELTDIDMSTLADEDDDE